MGLLELLGWSQRTPQPVGHDLETGDEPDDTVAWKQWLLRGGLFLGLVALTVAAFPRGDFYEYTVEVGDTWRQSNLSAPFNFPVYLDQERVEARRDTVRENTPPYFQEVQGASQQLVRNRDTLRRQLNRVLEAYASYRYHRQQGEREAARQDSLDYVRRRRNAQATLSASQWEYLASEYADEVQNLRSASRGNSDQLSSRLHGRLLDAAFEVGGQLLSLGVMNRARDSVLTDEIIVRNQQDQTQRRVDKKNLYGLNEAFEYAERQLRERFSSNREHSRIATSFFRAIFVPSLQYLRDDTMEERERRAEKVTAIQGGVEEGEPIVRTGQRVTQEVKRKLTSLQRAKSEQLGSNIVLKQLSGEALYTLLGFGFFFFYLYLLRPEIWSKNRDLILVSVVLALIIALYGVAIRAPWSLYVVPVPLASVLLTIVFNSRIALIGTLVLALTGGQMLGLDLEYTIATFFAGAFGIFSVRDIKNRGQFFVSGGLAFVGYALVATWLYLDLPFGRVAPDLAYAAIASAITITSSLFLWALERIFDITTDLTLLELSDTNRPLLKELSLRAPGSFNHTLQVANLAEAAADRVGAHALLTRVGALYHDIGKMKKPEYFVENQRTMSNPHDELKPRMSALIIASHVKEGLEMGTDDGLPEQVHKFIPMHHGTARIEYFYQKALSRAEDTDRSVPESEFRYPGPKPDSKETGILMLADSVEAASRSLDDPSPRRLENLIDLLFSERIDDGQLDNTDLTFRDLRLIKDTFLKMLLGIYHVRVKYPDQEEESAEPDFEVVSLRAERPYLNVSVVYDQDAWGAWIEPEEASPEHSRKEPRPQLADASPHSSAHPGAGETAAGQNGREEASATTASADVDPETEEPEEAPKDS